MQQLKAYLADAKLSQKAFADKIGVKQPTVSDWINGTMRPTVDNLIAISRETGISLDELVSDSSTEAA